MVLFQRKQLSENIADRDICCTWLAQNYNRRTVEFESRRHLPRDIERLLVIHTFGYSVLDKNVVPCKKKKRKEEDIQQKRSVRSFIFLSSPEKKMIRKARRHVPTRRLVRYSHHVMASSLSPPSLLTQPLQQQQQQPQQQHRRPTTTAPTTASKLSRSTYSTCSSTGAAVDDCGTLRSHLIPILIEHGRENGGIVEGCNFSFSSDEEDSVLLQLFKTSMTRMFVMRTFTPQMQNTLISSSADGENVSSAAFASLLAGDPGLDELLKLPYVTLKFEKALGAGGQGAAFLVELVGRRNSLLHRRLVLKVAIIKNTLVAATNAVLEQEKQQSSPPPTPLQQQQTKRQQRMSMCRMASPGLAASSEMPLYKEAESGHAATEKIPPRILAYGRVTLDVVSSTTNKKFAPIQFEAMLMEPLNLSLETFSWFLDKKQRMNPELLQDLWDGFYNALQVIHETGAVVHRDIKPMNMGIRYGSINERIEFGFLDYGIATLPGTSFDSLLNGKKVNIPAATINMTSPRTHMWMPAHPIDDELSLFFSILKFAWRDKDTNLKKALETCQTKPTQKDMVKILTHTLPWERFVIRINLPEGKDRTALQNLMRINCFQNLAKTKLRSIAVQTIDQVIEYIVSGDSLFRKYDEQDSKKAARVREAVEKHARENWMPILEWWVERAKELRERIESVRPPATEYYVNSKLKKDCGEFDYLYNLK
jgi:serine/threonine protein kinase